MKKSLLVLLAVTTVAGLLMPAINWTATADFGLEDHFQSEVIGNLTITTAGTYGFRLTSDDGSGW